MNILQIIDSLQFGGAERMAVSISNVLAKSGHSVVLCASRSKGKLEKFVEPGIKLVTLNKKSTIDFNALFRLLQIIRKNRIQIIHAHSSSVFWAILIKIIMPKIKVIWHDHLGARISGNSVNKYYKFISPLISGIISVNDKLKEWAVQNMRVIPKNILFINNFPLIRELPRNTKPGITKIVCLANLRQQKDHQTLVKAIHIIIKELPEHNLKFIFAGLFRHDAYYLDLIKLIKTLGLKETIQIKGPVEDTAALLAAADIGVLSSVSEGLPVILLEYGLVGLPVVVTDVGQCHEVTGDGKFGLVVPPFNPVELAKALIILINNKKRRSKMGDEFKKFVIEKYGAKQFLSQYNGLLKKMYRND